jgi:PAS domain S-box-containing protein
LKYEDKELKIKKVLTLVFEKNDSWSLINENIQLRKDEINSNRYIELQFEKDYFYILKLSRYGFLVLGRKKEFDVLVINDLKLVINFTGKILMESIEDKIRQEYEIKIANERKLLRTIIDNLPINVYAKDLQFRKTLSNTAELKQIGYDTEEQVLGKTDFDLFGMSIGENTLIEDRQVMIEGKPILDEEKHLNDGEWALISKLPLKDETEKIVGLVGISVNFTERKKNREQLEVFNLLFDNLSDGIQIAFEDGELFYVNKNASNFLDISQADITNYNISDIEILYKDVSKWNEIVDKTKITDKIIYETTHFHKKKNILVPVEVTVKHIFANKNAFIVLSIHDISERKKNEQELRYSNERLEQLAFQTRTVAWEVDSDGKYSYISPIVKHVLGYKPSELIGKKYFWDFLEPENKAIILKSSIGIIGKKSQFNVFENKLTTKAGNKIWFSTTVSPLYNNEGDFIGYRGSDTDITERKRNEQQVEENGNYQRSLLENLSVGIMIIDPKSQIVDTINSYACKIIDTTPEKIIGKKCFSNICNKDDINSLVCLNKPVADNVDLIITSTKGVEIPTLKTVKEIVINGEKKLLLSFIDISGRRQAEANLRESEERKASLISSMDDLVGVLDYELRFVELHIPENKSFAVSNQDIIGKRYDEIGLPQKVNEIIGNALNQCIATGNITKAVYYLIEDGIKKWHEINITTLKLNNGNGLTCVVRDISESKNNEEIIFQQIKLQELLIKISTTYINVNIDNINSVINTSLQEMGEYVGADRAYIFEYNFANKICKNTFEWCNSDFQPKLKDLQSIAFEDIKYWLNEHKLAKQFVVNDINEIQTEELKSILLRDKTKSLITIPLIHDNELMGFVGFDSIKKKHKYTEKEKQLLELFAQMLVNVEIRKRGQEMLVSQEEKYRNIISNMHLGFVELDVNDNITFINKQFCLMTGLNKRIIVGKNASLFLLPAERDILNKYKTEFIQNKHIPALELKLKNRKGEEMWWLVNGAAQYNDKNELIGSISVFFDITSQKQLQSELEKSKIVAENAAKAKELFLTNMSHEIRTPLNVIIGMTRELGKENLTHTQKKYLTHSEASAFHLLSIVNNVLDMSKIEAGEFTLDLNDFSLSAVLSNVKSILSSRAQSKNIVFKVNVDSTIATAFVGDSIRLSQVLINLLGNSIKFTDEGFVSLDVSIIKTNKYYEELKFEISDSGIGMSEEFQKDIFSKFTQESSKSNRNYEGTGLGMSISKEIVELMGGSIHVKSQKGKGTQISFSLNLPIGNEQKFIKIDSKTKRVDISKLKVLLVEDNEMNRFIARQSLLQANCVVCEAVNGIDAIEKLRSEDFDIVLMDIQMPKMDGVEATKIIRQEMDCKIPIIALTANAFKHDIDLYLSIGFNDFLIKPYKEEDLYNKLDINSRLKKQNDADNVHATSNSKLDVSAENKTDKLYDLSQLEEIGRNDAGFVNTMVDVFSNMAKQTIEELKISMAEGDIVNIKKIAHKIKPSIDNMSIISLHDNVRVIENYNGDVISECLKKEVDFFIDILSKVVAQLAKR